MQQRDLHHHCRIELFWKIQKIVETLQDDTSQKTFAAPIIVLPEDINITVYGAENWCRQLFRQVSALPELQTRNKHFSDIPEESQRYMLIANAKDCDLPPHAEVIARIAGTAVGGVLIPLHVSHHAFKLDYSDRVLKIESVHSSSVRETCGRFRDGDILRLCYAAPTRAGGHHQNFAAPPTLPAFSDFTARVEFLCDTHGWVATDEMFHYTQGLQWQQDWLRFGSPQLWNVANGDFE